MFTTHTTTPNLPGLTNQEKTLITRCINTLNSKTGINKKRSTYYDGAQPVKDLGISVPPQLTNLNTFLGWPAKAVDMLEARIELDGFTSPGTDKALQKYGLDTIWARNRLDIEASQAHTTALKYGCAFLAITKGDPGEPEIVIRTLSPTTTSVSWDKHARKVRAAISLIKTNDQGQPTAWLGFLPDRYITWTLQPNGTWNTQTTPHTLNRVPIAVLAFKPSVESPLGRSRITQGVMSIVDRAARTLLRMEVSAEFYASPQRYLLGGKETMFQDAAGKRMDRWSAVMSKMLVLPYDEAAGDSKPEIHQFSQMTMQPHMEMLRSDASLFAGETSIPVTVLGIIHDNPASDAAMHTAYLALNKEAERTHATFGSGWVDAMQMAWQLKNAGAELPYDLVMLAAVFRDPATPTKASLAQAVVSQVQAGVLPAVSEVTFELLGYDRTTVSRLMVASQEAAGDRMIDALLSKAATQNKEDVKKIVNQTEGL